jgi:hypothetical protein
MTSPITNSSNVQPVSPLAAQNVWAKEINPGVQQSGNNDSFNNSSQDPAAMNLNPDVKQLATTSANRMKTILIAAGTAIAAGLVYWKRKYIPYLNKWSDDIEKYLREKKPFESLNKFFSNKKSVTTLDELKNYADDAIKTPDPAFRRIKIHSKNLDGQSMANAIQYVRQIAEDLVTTSGNKGKKPVVHIILNPEYADKTEEIIQQLNSKSRLNISNNVIQKVEMIMEPSNKFYEKLIGEHSALINVGPPRYIDKKEFFLYTFWKWLTRPTPRQIPD